MTALHPERRRQSRPHVLCAPRSGRSALTDAVEEGTFSRTPRFYALLLGRLGLPKMDLYRVWVSLNVKWTLTRTGVPSPRLARQGRSSHRDLLRLLARCGSDEGSLARPVREIMNPNPVTTSPTTSLREAIQTMQDARTDSLPVISGGRLVGIVTTHDVLTVLAKMLVREQCDSGTPGSNSQQFTE